MRARVWASSVLPEPVGPTSRILLFSRSGSPLRAVSHALVVVVDGHRQHALGALLPDDVLVEAGVELLGRQAGARAVGDQVGEEHALVLAAQHLVAQVDALVADIGAGLAGDEAGDIGFLALAERAALDSGAAFLGMGRFLGQTASVC